MTTFLVFGDLHGRVLPAFAMARAWQREHEERIDALLQVGDLGYFPASDRLDRATRKFAARDPLELGVQEVLQCGERTRQILDDPDTPGVMWFVAGNHEDHEMLADAWGGPGSTDDDFPADPLGRLRCIVNGGVVRPVDGPRVGGLWGIDDQAPRARRHIPAGAKLDPRVARRLAMRGLDVLLAHESPRDAFFLDSGSEAISELLTLARPAFAFFGHYHGEGRMEECDFGSTQVYHLAGLEFQGKSRTAEPRCVGVMRWRDGAGSFDYVDERWLRSVHRDGWMNR